MKKTFLKVLGLVAVAATSLVLTSDLALAQDLTSTTDHVRQQLPGVADLISAVAYIVGIGFGLKAALKLKEHNESKGQIPLSQPITLAVVAALLLALPTLLSNSKGTVFGAGSQSTGLDGGGAIRNIQ